METVKNMRTLKAMAKRGLIELHSDTGTKLKNWFGGGYHTCFYVSDGQCRFEFNGQKYGVKYFDGCFNPFVVKFS
jgi:hypothetical protein